MQSNARMTVLVIVVVEEKLAERPSVLDRAEAGGEGRAVLERLVDRLGVRVVLLTCGREWVRLMLRSLSSSATPLEVIEVPRSAWMVKAPRSMPWETTAVVMSSSASSAVSVAATIQPTT